MSKVTGFTQGATSSGFNTWYVAILDCKHWHYSEGWQPFSPDIKIGTEVDCKTCSDHKAAEHRLESLNVSQVAYLRFSHRFAYPDQGIYGRYLAYRYDSTSPTGVINFDGFPATKQIDAIIDRRQIRTLSPTEGRQ